MRIREYISQRTWFIRIIAFLILYPIIFGDIWIFLDPLDPLGILILKSLYIPGYIGLHLIAVFISLISIVFFEHIFLEKKETLEQKKSLLSIEKALEKNNRRLKPKYFRKGGPLWIDFEKNLIYKPKQVDTIINQMAKEQLLVVEGPPASGKSVLLKYIGFELVTKKRFKVYYIGLKGIKSDVELEIYLDEANKIEKSKTLFILDDYHLRVHICENFLKDYLSKGKKKNSILIGTRPISKPIFGTSEFKIEDLKKVKISPEDASNGIIKRYLKKNMNIRDEEINDKLKSFKQYEKDLWYLSWALMTVKKEEGKTIEIRQIHEGINERIRMIDYAEETFYPLSILNRLEIPMEERFLVNGNYGLGIEKNKLDDLILHNEILATTHKGTEYWKGYQLHHSSLAELIFYTYRNIALGDNIKDRINEVSGNKQFNEESFLLYYLTHSDLLYYFDDFNYPTIRKIRSVISKKISNENLKGKVHEVFEHWTEHHDRGNFFYIIEQTSDEYIFELTDGFDLESWVTKINNHKDEEARLALILLSQGPFLQKIIKYIDFERIKLELIDDIERISHILGALSNTDKKMAADFVDLIGLEHIVNLFKNIQAKAIIDKRKIPINKETTDERKGSNIEEVAVLEDLILMAEFYASMSNVKGNLTDELIKIIQCKFEEFLFELFFIAILEVISKAAFTQSLFGCHYPGIEKFYDSLEEIVKIKLQSKEYIEKSKVNFPHQQPVDLKDFFSQSEDLIRESSIGIFYNWIKDYRLWNYPETDWKPAGVVEFERKIRAKLYLLGRTIDYYDTKAQLLHYNNNEDIDKSDYRYFFYLGIRLSRWTDEEFAKLVNGLDLQRFGEKFNNFIRDGGTFVSFNYLRGPFLKKMLEYIDFQQLKSIVRDDIGLISIILGALSNTDKKAAQNVIELLGSDHIMNLFTDISNVYDQAGLFGSMSMADSRLSEEFIEILKKKTLYLPINEIGEIIHMTILGQMNFGCHFYGIEKLLESLEELIKENIKSAVSVEAAKNQYREVMKKIGNYSWEEPGSKPEGYEELLEKVNEKLYSFVSNSY